MTLGRVAREVALRVGHLVLLVLVVVFVVSSLVHIAPGDPPTLGNSGDSYLRQQLSYVADLSRGDLGYSRTFQQPVSELVAGNAGPTVLLIGTGLLFAMLGGTLLGVYSARRPTRLSARLLDALGLAGFSVPPFILGVMLLMGFSAWWPVLPTQGMRSLIRPEGWISNQVDVAHHLLLPAVSIGFGSMAFYARIVRAALLEELAQDYVVAARAKGLGERSVVYKHALRNAATPAITTAGLQFSQVLSGAVIVEAVFTWPGLGTLALQATRGRDVSLLLGILVASTVIVVVVNWLTDLVCRVADPRLRSARGVLPAG